MTCRWKWKTVCQAAAPLEFRRFTPAAPSWSRARRATRWAVTATAKLVALRQKERLGAEGVNLLNAFGSVAWQTVFHFHLHVIPRYADDGMQPPARPGAGGGEDDIKAAGERLAP